MILAPNQLQMGTNTARGASRNSVLALTCRWQDRKHVLAGGQGPVSPASVLTDDLLTNSPGLRARHFSHSSLRGGSLPARAKAVALFPSRQMSSRHNFRGGPSRGAFVAAPVSRRFNSHAQIGVHAVQSYLADLPERHRFVSYAASSMDRTCSNRRPSNWVIQTIWSDRK